MRSDTFLHHQQSNSLSIALPVRRLKLEECRRTTPTFQARDFEAVNQEERIQGKEECRQRRKECEEGMIEWLFNVFLAT